MIDATTLSMDARTLARVTFSFGEKTSLNIGGVGAQSVLSERAAAAMKELVDGGYVTATEFNRYGRMQYQGTAKISELPRLSQADVEAHGKWSLTMPNPAAKGGAA